ncbi:MAG: hypothetical protein ABUL41_00385 [Chitinophagaceae bacterium]
MEKSIRGWLGVFIASLFLSGLTAIPIETELNFLSGFFSIDSSTGHWLDKVYLAFHETNSNYPFLAYGYDWLAFAHFVLALLFIGPLKDPVKNKWVIEFGMIACLLIVPFALIAGHYRSIPLGWRFIDCSFGIIGIIPLFICLKKIHKLESVNTKNYNYEIND